MADEKYTKEKVVTIHGVHWNLLKGATHKGNFHYEKDIDEILRLNHFEPMRKLLEEINDEPKKEARWSNDSCSYHRNGYNECLEYIQSKLETLLAEIGDRDG